MPESNVTSLLQENTSEALPYNLEAEQAVLGALLRDNEAVYKLGDSFLSSHFYDPLHKRLFEAIKLKIHQGTLANAITLKNQFEQDDGFQEIGGVRYLALLLANAAGFEALGTYGRVLRDLSLRRSLMHLSDEMKHQAAHPEPDQTGTSQLEALEQKLFTLAETGNLSKGFSPFSEALQTALDMAAAAYERDGGLSGLSTGFLDLDRRLGGLHASDLIILAGRPSMGKTALALNIAFHVARYRLKSQGKDDTGKGGVVGFFSLEMSSEQLATRLVADSAGVPSDRIRRGDITSEQYEKLRDAAHELTRLPLYLDDTGGLSIAALAQRARRLKRTEGLDLIIVDYLQLLTPSSRREGRVQEVSEITQNLKALAKELNIPVLALSQLSRKVEDRDDKRPQLADLRESGSIEQDADIVAFVFRESYYLSRQEPKEGTEEHLKWIEEMDRLRSTAEVIIGKQRHGPIGTVKLSFNEALTRFGNLAQDDRYSGIG